MYFPIKKKLVQEQFAYDLNNDAIINLEDIFPNEVVVNGVIISTKRNLLKNESSEATQADDFDLDEELRKITKK